MPAKFREFSVENLESLLLAFHFTRKIESIHLHHTWRPNHSQYRGLDSIVGMDNYHTEQGFGGLAQHLTLSPIGTLWTGRNWNRKPASAIGFNGKNDIGPFMIEMIGDFDDGKDPFTDPQRESAVRTVAMLLRSFKLPTTAIKFHNHLSQKSCPGTAIDYAVFCSDVDSILQNLDAETTHNTGTHEGPFSNLARTGSPNSAAIGQLVECLLSDGARSGMNTVDAELLEDAADRDAVKDMFSKDGRVSRSSNRDLDPDELEALRPHVINLRQGRLSTGGIFDTSKGHVEAIFRKHLVDAYNAKPASKPLRIVLWAHGGLVSEAKGLGIAHLQCPWWMKNDCYPIHFVWESGLLETLLPFIGRGVSRDIFDFTTDFAIEQAVRIPGSAAWGLMKLSAEAASTAADGGALLAAQLLKEFCDQHADVELHACGHSAGSIFHNHFIPACKTLGVPNFKWVHFLAPAVRVKNYLEKLHPLVGTYAKKISIYTMRETLEKADNVARVYRKSLLYLIRNALNLEFRSDILGLEECLLENDDLKQTYGLAGRSSSVGDCVFSKTVSDSGRNASRSTSHGGFDNDPSTMNSILRRILDLGDTDQLKADFPTQTDRDIFAGLDIPTPVQPGQFSSGGTESRGPATIGSSRRIALCVGIDTYPSAPLSGCVNDARLWARTLQQLGFHSVRTIINQEATHRRISEELAALVSAARPGDSIVFQYSGHGTEVPDMDGDERFGKDQAFVPVDYDAGKFLIDDEVRLIFSRKHPGVNLTCFIDCCHSGSITRMLGDGPPPLALGQRARFITLNEAEESSYRAFREVNPVARTQAGFYAISFVACQDSEVALESNGQGDFTRNAVPLLRGGFQRLTHAQFQRQVISSFGSSPRQNPNLDCDPTRSNEILLAPLISSGPAPQPLPGNNREIIDSIQTTLRRLSEDLGKLG